MPFDENYGQYPSNDPGTSAMSVNRRLQFNEGDSKSGHASRPRRTSQIFEMAYSNGGYENNGFEENDKLQGPLDSAGLIQPKVKSFSYGAADKVKPVIRNFQGIHIRKSNPFELS